MSELKNPRAVEIEAINLELVRLNEDGSSQFVEKGDPNGLIIQLNLNYVDYGKLIALAELGIKAMQKRTKELLDLEERHKNNPIPELGALSADDIRLARTNSYSRSFEASGFLESIRRKFYKT